MLKKSALSLIVCLITLVSILGFTTQTIHAEGLTSQQQIQSKIAQQPQALNKYVGNLLSNSPEQVEYVFNTIYAARLDSDRILYDGHGYLEASLEVLKKNPVAAQDLDDKGSVIHEYNLMTDTNATTLGAIKSAYYEAIKNGYQHYYPAPHYE